MSPAGLALLVLCWSAALWAGASLICHRKPSPRMAQAVWRGAALLMFAPFAASLIVPGMPALEIAPLPDVPALEPFMVVPENGVAAPAAGPAFQLPGIGLVVIVVVAAGWLVRFLLWGISQVRLQRLKARAMRTQRPVGHWAEAIGLKRAPDVRVIPRGAPFLAGIWKRSVYVPAALIRGAGAQQVIVHELVHLKRGDLIARPLERIVADIFWFTPFAWGIRNQLDFWREAVVDQETVELTGDRIAYARALTSAARASRDEAVLPVAAFILRKKGTLKMRLNELLTENPRPRRVGLMLAAALVCAAPLALAQGMLIRGAAAGPASAAVIYSHAVLDKAKLTSAYGMRTHPITGEQKFHNGVDLAEEEGKPVYTPANGTVVRAEYSDAYGNVVEVATGGTKLRFGQLKDIKVAAGDAVAAGKVIGTLGQTGQATGPHLHFEVWRGDVPVDPLEEDGLVLADSLVITKGSGVKAPAPPAPPAVPAVPGEARPVPAAAPAAPAPPPVPPACDALKDGFEAPVTDEVWTVRLEKAGAANKAAGVTLKDDWTPETLSHPVPVYPAKAIDGLKSGVCNVMFDLGTDGLPKNMLAACSDPVFADSAAELKGARFAPATGADGKPVEVKGVIYPLQYCIG